METKQKKTDIEILDLMCSIAAVTGRELEDIKNEACEMCGIDPESITILKKGEEHGQRQE